MNGPLTYREIGQRVDQSSPTKVAGESIYDWCWVCGLRLGPDRMHVMIDNGRLVRHTYACRKHRYVVVEVKLSPLDVVPVSREVQQRTDYEIESLSHAFRAGELKPGWE